MARELKGDVLRVHDILEANEDARNCDWVMIARYVAKYHHSSMKMDEAGSKYSYLRDWHEFTPAETLVRARRIVQNDMHLHLPTNPKVRKARRIKEQNYREAEVREAKQIKIT